MRAHIDLNDKHDAGGYVNSADLKKHRKDVLRLPEFVPGNATLALPARIKADAERFIATVEDPEFRIDQLSISLSRTEAIARLNALCRIHPHENRHPEVLPP